MKIKILGICAIAALAGALSSFAAGGGKMKISSSAFQEGGNIPSKFTCDGTDANPPLRFEGAPAESKNLVLIADDPAAPSVLFTHWLIWNMDPKTTEIAQSSEPCKQMQQNNHFDKAGDGEHRP